jgi:alkylmercury lyase
MKNARQEEIENTLSSSPASHPRAGREAFAAYLNRRVLTENTLEHQRLSVELLRLLGRGAPVTREQLGTACGLAKGKIDKLLSEFPPTNFVVDERGQLIAFAGLSLVPTHHHFDTNDTKLYTWCVFDAFFLPEILGKPATLTTRCPESETELVVELAPGELRSVPSSGCVMSIVTPDSAACCVNLRSAFCDHVNLFKDERTFVAWARGRPATACVTLAEAQIFARQRNVVRYPDIDLSA